MNERRGVLDSKRVGHVEIGVMGSRGETRYKSRYTSGISGDIVCDMKRLQEMTTAELMVLCHQIANNPAADEDTRKKAYEYAVELSVIGPPRSPVDEEKDAAIMNCAIEFIELNLYLT